MRTTQRRFAGWAALAAVVLLGSVAEAGPFTRRTVTTTRAKTCTGGSCQTASTRTVTHGGSAQAHAEAMAASGALVHASSHPGFEGVGTGATPEQAEGNACTNGGAIFDKGVAFGHGRYWACIRRR